MHSKVPSLAGIRRPALGLLVAGAAWLSLGGTSYATDYPVSNLLDTGAGSLRAAVASANANAGPDSVSFGATTGTIELTSGQISITGPVDIVGPSPFSLAVDANENSRIFGINNIPDPGVEISGLRFTGGQPADCGCGGAIQNFNTHLLISNSNFDHNDATWGGAIESFQAELELEHAVFSANTSSHDIGGGAVHVGEGEATVTDSTFVENEADVLGGAIQAGGAKLTVRGSTIVGNETEQDGGGIQLSRGKAKLINSTVTDNTAAKFGAGIDNFKGRLTLKSSTVANNTGKNGGGISGIGKQKLSSSIVADNTATSKGPDLFGEFKSNFSLIEKTEKAEIKGRKNILGKNPKLGDLGDHGGLTDTIELLDGSRAIDKGAKSAPPLDQRGYSRDNKPDIGAFEFGAMP